MRLKLPPQIGDSDVTDLTAVKTIDLTGETDEQADIQDAIDTLSGAGGGVLYFVAGKYQILTHLYIKDNVRIYLAPGARIYYPGGTWKYLYFDNVDSASIEGRGSIDGPMIKSQGGSTNIVLQDFVTLPHVDGWWAIEAEYTTGFTATNVKIINDWSITSDGFDIEYTSNSLVEDCFIYSGDDALVVHAPDQGAKPNITNVTFRDCVVYSGSSGCKIGSDTYNTLTQDVTFENIDIVSYSHSALSLNHSDGATLDDIYFTNIRVEQWIDRGLGDENVIRFVIWDVPGIITDVYVLNLTADISEPSRITGYDVDNKITNVTLDNYYIEGALVENEVDGDITTNAFVENLVFTSS